MTSPSNNHANSRKTEFFSVIARLNPFSDGIRADSLYLIANAFVGSLSGFVFWLVCARFFAVSEVGLAASTVSLLSVLAIFATIGVPQTVIRFIGTTSDRKSFVSIALLLPASIGIILGIILVILAGLFPGSRSLLFGSLLVMILFPILVASQTLNFVADSVFIGLKRAKFVLLRGSMFNLSKILLVLLLLGTGATGILVGWGLSLILSFAVALLWLIPKLIPGFSVSLPRGRTIDKSTTSFSIASYLETSFLFSSPLILPVIVGTMSGAEYAASVYVGIMILNFLATISDSTARAFVAFASTNQSAMQIRVRRCLTFSLALTSVAAISAIILSHDILGLFGQAYSSTGTNALRILCFSAFPLALNYQYFAILRILKKMRELVFLAGTIFAVTVCLAAYLVPIMSSTGAALGYLLAQLAVCLVVLPRLVAHIRTRSTE